MTEQNQVILSLDKASARCLISAITLAAQCVTSKGMLLYSLTRPEADLSQSIVSHLVALTGQDRIDLNNYHEAMDSIEPKLKNLMELALNILKQTEPEHVDEIEASLDFLRRC